MSWRFLLFWAAVVVVVFGAGIVVADSGSPDRGRGGSPSHQSRTNQEILDSPPPFTMSPEELAQCPVPTFPADGRPHTYACAYFLP